MKKDRIHRKFRIRYWWISICVVLPGCARERQETPTKGHVTIAVSESISPLLRQEKQKFEELYPEAVIDLQVTTARDAIASLFNDSLKVIVSSRPLNSEERDVQKKFHLAIDEYKIAIDGIAIIVNDENPVKGLRTTQLDSLLRGFTTRWDNVGWEHSSAAIDLCLPDQNSGTFEVVGMKILHGERFATPTKIVHSSTTMLEYVSSNTTAIGMVGINWIGEGNGKVRVLELTDPNAPDSLGISGQYFPPLQAHLYRGYYPLTRDVFVYSRADGYGVAAGFISFMTSPAGQKIVLGTGLVPATMPIRLVELTKRDIQQ